MVQRALVPCVIECAVVIPWACKACTAGVEARMDRSALATIAQETMEILRAPAPTICRPVRGVDLTAAIDRCNAGA